MATKCCSKSFSRLPSLTPSMSNDILLRPWLLHLPIFGCYTFQFLAATPSNSNKISQYQNGHMVRNWSNKIPGSAPSVPFHYVPAILKGKGSIKDAAYVVDQCDINNQQSLQQELPSVHCNTYNQGRIQWGEVTSCLFHPLSNRFNWLQVTEVIYY